MSYLTLLIISAPILASNNRGENSGNGQTLQKVHTRQDTRTVISGYALKRAIRDNMQKAGATMWRESLDNPDNTNPAGYTYTKSSGGISLDMVSAVPATAESFDDTILFGYLVAGKGEVEKEAGKQRAQVNVSPALSTTPWDGDTAFAQGLKAKGEKEGQAPTLAPFTYERHYTRYQFTVTVNLNGIKGRPGAVKYLLQSLRGLQAGGSHASNASEIIPEAIAWRFHKEPGTGGLYLGGGLDYEPDAAIDMTALKARLEDLGLSANFAGKGFDLTINDALTSLVTDALAAVPSVK